MLEPSIHHQEEEDQVRAEPPCGLSYPSQDLQQHAPCTLGVSPPSRVWWPSPSFLARTLAAFPWSRDEALRTRWACCCKSWLGYERPQGGLACTWSSSSWWWIDGSSIRSPPSCTRPDTSDSARLTGNSSHPFAPPSSTTTKHSYRVLPSASNPKPPY